MVLDNLETYRLLADLRHREFLAEADRLRRSSQAASGRPAPGASRPAGAGSWLRPILARAAIRRRATARSVSGAA